MTVRFTELAIGDDAERIWLFQQSPEEADDSGSKNIPLGLTEAQLYTVLDLPGLVAVLAEVQSVSRPSSLLPKEQLTPQEVLEKFGVTARVENFLNGTKSSVHISIRYTDEVDGTVLYADMADSTALVDRYNDEFAAEVYKAYLLSACRVIRSNGGEITAFDGDRVMAVFVGTTKNTEAVRSALQLNYMVGEVNKAIKAQYATATFSLAHCTGIDTSPLFVAKTGIRQYNDLVWVGRAANYAAKLSALNEPGYPTLITDDVYKKLHESTKFGGSPRRDMWEKRTWAPSGKVIYRLGWW